MKKIIGSLLSALAIAGCSHPAEKVTLPAKSVLLDVRSQAEYQSDHIAGAICIPHDQIAEKAPGLIPDKNTPIYLYCRSGRRVKIAMETLQQNGYNDLHDLGGIEDARKILDMPRSK